jgi:hypothetical protein
MGDNPCNRTRVSRLSPHPVVFTSSGSRPDLPYSRQRLPGDRRSKDDVCDERGSRRDRGTFSSMILWRRTRGEILKLDLGEEISSDARDARLGNEATHFEGLTLMAYVVEDDNLWWERARHDGFHRSWWALGFSCPRRVDQEGKKKRGTISGSCSAPSHLRADKNQLL